MPTTNRRPSWRVSAANEAGEGYKAGIGTTAIGGKFDFYGDERRGISVAVYPQLEFAPAHGAEKGLSEAGQTIVRPLLVAREFQRVDLRVQRRARKTVARFSVPGAEALKLQCRTSPSPSRELASGFGFAFGRSFISTPAAASRS